MDPLPRVYLGSLASVLVDFVCVCVAFPGIATAPPCLETKENISILQKREVLHKGFKVVELYLCACLWECVRVTFPVAATAPPLRKTKEKTDCPAKGCFA